MTTTSTGRDFTGAVTQLLAIKKIQAPDHVVAEEVARVDPVRHTTLLRYLSRSDIDLASVDPETPIPAQIFLARLIRRGVTTIGLPACPSCHQRRVLRRRDPEQRRVCHRCYERQHYGECPTCQRMKKLTSETDDQGRRLCPRCSPQGALQIACSACGKNVTVAAKIDGQDVCLSCYPCKPRTCSACGKEKKVASHIRSTPHCFACHNRILRNPQPCPICRDKRILAFTNEVQTPICAGCAGQPARYACRRCGSEENAYGRLCGKCTLRDRLTVVLSNPDSGHISEPMQVLFNYLTQLPRPEQIIKWLHMGPHTDLLHEVAIGVRPLTEQTLATAEGGKGLLHLRSLLADSGALAYEQPALARLHTWCDQQLAVLRPAERIIVNQYLQWELLRRAKRNNTGDILEGAASHVQAVIRGIVNLIAWLDRDQQTALRNITQEQIDRYTLSVKAGRWLPQLLRWATTNDHIEFDVAAPSLQIKQPAVTLTEDRLDRIVDAVLKDTSLRPSLRLGVLLIAMYGLPARRIVRLERTQIIKVGAHDAALTFGEHQLVLPPPVADISRVHLQSISDSQTTWLFPGHRPGQHMSDQQFRRALEPYDVTIAQLQTAARYRLAGAVPAKILADSLDFDLSTIAKYASLSGGRWGDYPFVRATHGVEPAR